MAPHLFLSDSDGHLYDTRAPNWSASPLRRAYSRHWPEILSPSMLKASLRAGGYAWPGGYPLYFHTRDGEALSFETVCENLRLCLKAFAAAGDREWRVVGCGINWEDAELYCAHSGKRIPSAYADDDAPDV